MTPVTTAAEFALTLTEEERAQLLRSLEHLLRDKRLEIHRTESSEFRQYLEREEAVLGRLIEKLRRP